MKEDHEIRSTAFPANMSAWCSEKVQRTLESIVHVIEKLRSSEALMREEQKIVLDNLYYAVWDSCKLLSFGAGADWSTEDARLIFDEGDAGLEKVLARYGLLAETSNDRKRSEIDRFCEKLEHLLNGPRTNRTLVHDLLMETRVRHPLLEDIRDHIEQVTMNESKWDKFVLYGVDVLRHLREAPIEQWK